MHLHLNGELGRCVLYLRSSLHLPTLMAVHLQICSSICLSVCLAVWPYVCLTFAYYQLSLREKSQIISYEAIDCLISDPTWGLYHKRKIFNVRTP